jgi:secreted trypsin-like serine protease
MWKGKSSYVFYCTYILFQGDRGGPLVASSRLVGIYSVGYEGLVPTYPGLFTKVSAVCDWIIINAGLFKISAFINWIETIPGLQTMPLTFIATYSNN